MQRKMAEQLALQSYAGTTLSGRDWRELAACLDEPDREFFFRADKASVRQARAVCRSCPVRTDCLARALSMPFNPIGTWGGLTARERRLLINESGAADRCQTCGAFTGRSRNAVFCPACKPTRGSWRLPSLTAGTVAGSGGYAMRCAPSARTPGWRKAVSHGEYLPENIRYSWWRDPATGEVNRDHHLVYLMRVPPGRQRATRVKIGELRRYRLTGRRRRYWRAFPEGVLEYPPVFDDPGGHYRALEYLKQRWETGLIPE